MFRKRYEILPNTIGFLYKNNVFEKELTAGIYEFWDWQNRTKIYSLPTNLQYFNVINQEVLTKDNIALRFSFFVIYKIIDGQKVLKNINLYHSENQQNMLLSEIESRLRDRLQLHFRSTITEIESEMLNEKRNELVDLEKIQTEMADFGVVIKSVQTKDITFPKAIQELFAKHLEAKICAKAELENARTAVATARALKNASELMKGDENIKFVQMLETITKIASKGKHTFMIGDLNQFVNK